MTSGVQNNKKSVMGVPWYTEDTWNEMRNISEDEENFHSNFQEWLATADKSIVLLTTQNRPFLRLDIDPISYSWWCDKNSLKKDRDSRRAYIQYVLDSKIKSRAS
ncbi:MAG: hypothetical protein AAGB35_08835 [Pseudomonadota bacterium]